MSRAQVSVRIDTEPGENNDGEESTLAGICDPKKKAEDEISQKVVSAKNNGSEWLFETDIWQSV